MEKKVDLVTAKLPIKNHLCWICLENCLRDLVEHQDARNVHRWSQNFQREHYKRRVW